MLKGVPKRKFSGEFKQMVVEAIRSEHLGYREAAQRFEINDHKLITAWERIYLEEGPESLYVERRGRARASGDGLKGRRPKLNKKVEEDLIAENQRLRAEVDYLKKLNALVLEEERLNKRRK